MWECKICRREIEAGDTTCWSCGGKKGDVELVEDKNVYTLKDETSDITSGDVSNKTQEKVEVPERTDFSRDKYKFLRSFTEKINHFVDKLSQEKDLSSKIIANRLVMCNCDAVVDSGLLKDVFQADFLSDMHIFACIYFMDSDYTKPNLLIFTEQGLVEYKFGRLALIEYKDVRKVIQGPTSFYFANGIIGEISEKIHVFIISKHNRFEYGLNFPSTVFYEMEYLLPSLSENYLEGTISKILGGLVLLILIIWAFANIF